MLLARVDPRRAEAVGELLLAREDVGDRQHRPLLREPGGEPSADLTEARDGDPAPGDVARPCDPLQHGADRGVDAQARRAGGLAGAAHGIGQAHHVRGALADDEHVVGRAPHVLRRPVEPAEGFDGVAEVQERRAPLIGVEPLPLCEPDHGLAAAGVESGGGVLEGHRGREPQRVAESVAPTRVGPQPRAAERGSEHRRVERHGDEQPAAPAGDHLHALVGEIGQGQGVRHRVLFRRASWACSTDAAAVRRPPPIMPQRLRPDHGAGAQIRRQTSEKFPLVKRARSFTATRSPAPAAPPRLPMRLRRRGPLRSQRCRRSRTRMLITIGVPSNAYSSRSRRWMNRR